MSAGRYALLVGIGTPVWLGGFIGGAWLSNVLLQAAGWPAAALCLAVVVGTLIGVPVYLHARSLERIEETR
jgi:hypothetical protein